MALLGPELYRTSIVPSEPGAVLMVTEASSPGETSKPSLVTASDGAGFDAAGLGAACFTAGLAVDVLAEGFGLVTECDELSVLLAFDFAVTVVVAAGLVAVLDEAVLLVALLLVMSFDTVPDEESACMVLDDESVVAAVWVSVLLDDG